LTHSDLIAKMTLEQKVALCSGLDKWRTKSFEEFGIPSILMTDGPHGLRRIISNEDLGVETSRVATCFPTASLSACSWDRDLLFEMGEALGEEALQEGISIILGPGVNIQRNPLCGRNFEYFSEDPHLAGEMGTAWIQGVQSTGVGVSIKHFAGNNQENLRMTSDSLIDERALREIYLPAFERAVKGAKPVTVMSAYNKLNGVYCSEHIQLLQGILRDEWGFEGAVISDWGAVTNRVAAFNAGLDLQMPSTGGLYDDEVIQAVKSGRLAEEKVNQCVERLLNLVFWAQEQRKPGFKFDPAAHHALARKIAVSSGVLLKNEDSLLPLRPGQKIAVIGGMAETPRFQGAGSSIVNPTMVSNALQGFHEHNLDYRYYPGYEPKGVANPAYLQAAVAGAGECDVAVIFAGLPENYESEGFDRPVMSMPDSHNELIRRVAAVQPNTVVVLAGGAPIEMPWLSEVKSVLNMLLAGQAGGLAAADLLTGSENPCGKLSATYPVTYQDVPSADYYGTGGNQAQYRESIYVGYRYYEKANRAVAFPFGHGLSYTTFEYSGLKVEDKEFSENGMVKVRLVLKNTGQRAGTEVVQCYVGFEQTEVFRPVKELRGFTKVFLQPGEEKAVEFTLIKRDFAIWDVSLKDWSAPAGSYVVAVGASSRDIRVHQSVTITGNARMDSSASLSPWYIHPQGVPTPSDFATVFGAAIPPELAPGKGRFSLLSTLNEMSANPIVAIVIRQSRQTIRRGFGPNPEENPNFRMTMEGLMHTPLKSIVPISNGEMPLSRALALVHFANGKFVKGILSLLGLKIPAS